MSMKWIVINTFSFYSITFDLLNHYLYSSAILNAQGIWRLSTKIDIPVYLLVIYSYAIGKHKKNVWPINVVNKMTSRVFLNRNKRKNIKIQFSFIFKLFSNFLFNRLGADVNNRVSHTHTYIHMTATPCSNKYTKMYKSLFLSVLSIRM